MGEPPLGPDAGGPSALTVDAAEFPEVAIVVLPVPLALGATAGPLSVVIVPGGVVLFPRREGEFLVLVVDCESLLTSR